MMNRRSVVVFFFFLLLFSSSTLYAFLDKDAGMPPYVMMEILEDPSLTLSDLRRLYISFDSVRKALKARSSIMRTKIQAYMDDSLTVLNAFTTNRLPPPKWFWPKIKTLEGELKALHFFMKSKLGCHPEKGIDELTDAQKLRLVELLLTLEPKLEISLWDYQQESKKRMADRVSLFACTLLSALAQNEHLTLKAHPLYAQKNSPVGALTFKLARHLTDRLHLTRYDSEQRPFFYYLFCEGADKPFQMAAAQYFVLVFPGPKTWESLLVLADQLAGVDDRMTKTLLDWVLGNDESLQLVESVGRIAQKMGDMKLQNTVVGEMNRLMNLDDHQKRQERRKIV